MKNLSSLPYKRLRLVRGWRRNLPDLPETASPRYEKNRLASHRRGEKREERWLKYV